MKCLLLPFCSKVIPARSRREVLQVSGTQLPLGTGRGSRKSLGQGWQPRALEKSPVPAGGSAGRLPCFQHPCRSRAKRLSHPTGRRDFCERED